MMVKGPKQAEYNRKWIEQSRLRNPEHYKKLRKINQGRLKARVFLLYGNECNSCHFNDSRALQLDHKSRPTGAFSTEHHTHGQSLCREILSGKVYWLDYQLLCANCNWIKKIENNELGLRHGKPSKFERVGQDND